MSENNNAAAAADFMKGLHSKAEKLKETREFLAQREEEYKKMTDEAFATEKKLKEELLGDLKTLGLKSVKVANGDSFFISPRKSFIIKNEIAMMKWAELNKLMKPDTILLKQKLEACFKSNALPSFAEVEVKESISFKANKTDDADQKV